MKRMRPIMLLALTLAIVLATAPSAGAIALGHITGQVEDAVTHASLAGVWAFTQHQTAPNTWNSGPAVLTDGSGRYTLDCAPGTYTVGFSDPSAAHADAYWPAWPYWHTETQEFAVSADTTYTRDATMSLPATLTVRLVTEATGGVPAGTMFGGGTNVAWNYGFNYLLDPGAIATWNRLLPGAWRITGQGSDYYDAMLLKANGSAAFDLPVSTTTTFTVPIRHKPTFYKDVIRKAGPSRYVTALEMAKETYPAWDYLTDVVVASGEDAHLVDALSASGLCGAYNAPLLLVQQNALPPLVDSAFRVMPNGIHVHIVGGTPSVSDGVKNAIAAIPTVASVDRCSGTDRYKTAAQVAWWMKTKLTALPTTTAFVVNGESAAHFWDALALGSVARGTNIPILLTQQASVPATTSGTLTALGLSNRYIAGGPSSVSNAVATALNVPPARRLAGANRYATAVAISEEARARAWFSPTFRYGIAASLPDALATGPMLGTGTGGPLLLTQAGSATLQFETRSYLTSGTIMPKLQVGFVAGGTDKVPETQRLPLMTAINP